MLVYTLLHPVGLDPQFVPVPELVGLTLNVNFGLITYARKGTPGCTTDDVVVYTCLPVTAKAA